MRITSGWLACVMVVLSVCSADAGGLAPSKASDVVSAMSAASACPFGPGFTSLAIDHVVNPDGTGSALTIPDGKVLVVTEAEVTTSTATAGHTLMMKLDIGNATNSDIAAVQFATVEAGRTARAIFLFPTGMVVKPGTVLCPEADDLTSPGFVSMTGTLHGYFAKDK